jgi:hypothetical protein
MFRLISRSSSALQFVFKIYGGRNTRHIIFPSQVGHDIHRRTNQLAKSLHNFIFTASESRAREMKNISRIHYFYNCITKTISVSYRQCLYYKPFSSRLIIKTLWFRILCDLQQKKGALRAKRWGREVVAHTSSGLHYFHAGNSCQLHGTVREAKRTEQRHGCV